MRAKPRAGTGDALAAATLFAIAVAVGCEESSQPGEEIQPRETTPSESQAEGIVDPSSWSAKLPHDAKPYFPAQVEGGEGAGARLADSARCAPCHADVVAQFGSSAHAFASFTNPIYRVSVDAFRDAAGKVESRFCAGCHDIALLADGAMDAAVVSADDARARAGVSCNVCHGIESVRPGGNASFTLTSAEIPIPDMADRASIDRHVEHAALKPLRTPALCATCHKTFLGEHTGHPHFIAGADDVLPWKRSVYAGSIGERVDSPVEKADCRGCHMPMETATRGDAAATDGRVASHRFAGGHTWLAAMTGDAEQLARTQAMLTGVASIDVAAAIAAGGVIVAPAEEVAVVAGASLEIDVVVRNLGVGHGLPGGTLDSQDTWIQVEVRDAHGGLVAEAGGEHEASGDDPTAHRLRVELVDELGLPLRAREIARFRAAAYDHSIPARDSIAVRYALRAPTDPAALPLRITAKLRHRARPLELQAAACEATRSERGAAFAVHAPIDPCAPQPVTDMATTTIALGAGGPIRGADPAVLARRLTDHGRAMLKAVQERCSEAEPSLVRALEIADEAGLDLERAIALSLLGELAGKQGRTDDALVWFERAEAYAPDHPALAAGRGRSLAAVWRFEEARLHFADASRGAPNDERILAQLAMAEGSANHPADALASAHRGLALAPRQPDLLRSQALALRALVRELPTGGDVVSPQVRAALDTAAEGAQAAHLWHRPFDEAPNIRSECNRRVPGCALERDPVHTHGMRQRSE